MSHFKVVSILLFLSLALQSLSAHAIGIEIAESIQALTAVPLPDWRTNPNGRAYIDNVFIPAMGTQGWQLRGAVEGAYFSVQAQGDLCRRLGIYYIGSFHNPAALNVTSISDQSAYNLYRQSATFRTGVDFGHYVERYVLEDLRFGSRDATQDALVREWADAELRNFQNQLLASMKLFSAGQISEARAALGRPIFCSARGNLAAHAFMQGGMDAVYKMLPDSK